MADELDTDERRTSRRDFIKKAAGAGAVAWTAPLIIESLVSPAFATHSGNPPAGCYLLHYVPTSTSGSCQAGLTSTAGGCAASGTKCSSPGPAPSTVESCLSVTTPSSGCAKQSQPVTFTMGCSTCTIVAAAGQTDHASGTCGSAVIATGNKSVTFTGTGNWNYFDLWVSCT